jgi:phospholipid-binding lipoprotein MlaA
MTYKTFIKFLHTCILIIACSNSYAIYESAALNYYQIDPLENYNRHVFILNSVVDKTVIRPTTVAYVDYVPHPFRYVAQNFFNNLRDFITLANDILQLDGMDSMQNFMRIAINSTFGLAGLIDISSSLGLAQNKNTFGHTLQVYGWHHSSYFMIPFLGPSTVRDAIGLVPDTIFNPTWWLIPGNYVYVSVGLYVVNLLDQRSKFLNFDQLLSASIDPYATLRYTYLQAHDELPPMMPVNNESDAVNIDSLIDTDQQVMPNNSNESLAIESKK